jgi:hypothetical protein
MKSIRILGAAILAFASLNVAMAGGHEGGPAITGEGACTFVQENMFAGPFDVCQEPVGPESCAALGEADDNAAASHSEGACPSEGLVGTCDLGSSKVNYLSGDADGLEIGCGFQGGDWIPAS